jgi:hypothetical protein
LFAGAKAGSSKMNSDDVVESLTKNTKKRESTISAVDSPAMATRAKEGTSSQWHVGSSGTIVF